MDLATSAWTEETVRVGLAAVTVGAASGAFLSCAVAPLRVIGEKTEAADALPSGRRRPSSAYGTGIGVGMTSERHTSRRPGLSRPSPAPPVEVGGP